MDQSKVSTPPLDAKPPDEPKLNIPWRPILCIAVPVAALAYLAMAVAGFW